MNTKTEYARPRAPESLPISWLHLLGEAVILCAAFALAHYFRFQSGYLPPAVEFIPIEKYLILMAVTVPLWLILHLGHGLYFQKIGASSGEEISALVNAQMQGFLLLVLASFFIRDFPESRLTLLLIFAFSFLLCLGWRIALRFFRTGNLLRGIGAIPVIVLGESPLGELLVKRIAKSPQVGYSIRERLSLDAIAKGIEAPVLRHVFGETGSPAALLIAGEVPEDALGTIIAECHRTGVECILPLERTGAAGVPSSASMLEGVPVVRLASPGELAWIRLKKRIFDLLLVILFLPIWLPLLILISLASLAAQGAPVFFSHERLGRGDSTIRLLKFRTMVRDASKMSIPAGFEDKFKSEADPRITRFGAFLRRTSLDELPQIINILRGDISIVGPRPIVRDELSKYGYWAGLLRSVPPGLTGLWQVSGRSDLSYDQRVELDTYYIHNWSLALDIRIILQTLPAVLSRKGAY
ncbi:MAG: sugar transferase [bacterium]